MTDNRQSTFDVSSPLAHRDVQWTLIVVGSVLLVYLLAVRIATVPTATSNRPDLPIRAEGNPPRGVGDASVLGLQIDINRARSHELACCPGSDPCSPLASSATAIGTVTTSRSKIFSGCTGSVRKYSMKSVISAWSSVTTGTRPRIADRRSTYNSGAFASFCHCR